MSHQLLKLSTTEINFHPSVHPLEKVVCRFTKPFEHLETREKVESSFFPLQSLKNMA
jgi:hypothetical protein